jgi:hypothetical protein
MTSNSTENYRAPLYAKAVVLLTQMATPLFNRAYAAGENTKAGEECFEQWYFLKALTDRIARSHAITLSNADREGLKVALSIVHDIAHDAEIDGAPDLATCECGAACRFLEFGSLVTEYEAQLCGGINSAVA